MFAKVYEEKKAFYIVENGETVRKIEEWGNTMKVKSFKTFILYFWVE